MFEKRELHFGIDESGNGQEKAVYVSVYSTITSDRAFMNFPAQRGDPKHTENMKKYFQVPARGYTALLFEKKLLNHNPPGQRTDLPKISWFPLICGSLVLPVLKQTPPLDRITFDIDGVVSPQDRECLKQMLNPYSEVIVVHYHPKSLREKKGDEFYRQPIITAAADFKAHELYSTHCSRIELEKLAQNPEFVPFHHRNPFNA